MCILSFDLGKFKSVACIYIPATGDTPAQHSFRTLPTTPAAIHDMFVEVAPRQVLIEVGPAAGWVKDLCETLEIPIAVANTHGEAWKWKNVKRKTDKDDALKLPRLWIMGEFPKVELPTSKVRQWRSLIAYRHTLVARRTAIKNNIRSLLDRQGIAHTAGKSGWTAAALASLAGLAKPMEEASDEELWRGQVHVELEALRQSEEQIVVVESRLEKIAQADERVALLQTIPGVGPRLSETVVAIIDNPNRFRNGKQVGAYAGLVPKQLESGTMERSGRITRCGNKLMRMLLVEVSWLMRRYNEVFRATFDRVCRGSKTRRKIAVVATARKLLVTCWAMLRDKTAWRGGRENVPLAT